MPTGFYKRSEKELDRLRKMMKEIGLRNDLKVKKICEVCKKSYLCHNFRKNTSRFCSRECFLKASRMGLIIYFSKGHIRKIKRIEYNCKECGKIKTIAPSQYKYYKNAGSFCSLICKNKNKKYKKDMANVFVGRMPIPIRIGYGTNRHVKVFNGKYLIGNKNIYFRSKWEANYAVYLDFLKKNNSIKDWLFEKDVFIFQKIKFGTRSYRPDFKVFNNDGTFEYHEIKGWMDKKSKTKLNRMRIYFPNIKMVLIQQNEYREIMKYKNLLKFY
ncbi:MAG: hypothetical protein UT24_C0016G0054 [Candidatus Woesebacteria bacterium GW2011_GWB1_39_12]|uniref:Uncharacterized protein n=1 Tax=Candidatus Woesebacteria bacterium GW2011_GWB1_39_12 TaxID=1618574 RepID=A0A0G0PPS4_9BACT|nr:MAG: hypothetical protein UT24_C0016G0054 [Candidatus Woesebacteria bacterium GW2011_GWB1_39_12]